MKYDSTFMITEFGIRTKLNYELLKDISNIYGKSSEKLKTLSAISKDKPSLAEIRDIINERKKNKAKAIEINTLQELFTLHSRHENRSKALYEQINKEISSLGDNNALQIPKDLYFDGTQLINSLYGLIVLSSEGHRLSRNSHRVREEKYRKYGKEHYRIIHDMIQYIKRSDWQRDKKFYCSYVCNDGTNHFERDEDVSQFLQHLRNAIAHSGSGKIQFFPITDSIGCINVTDIAFFDQQDDMLFYAKLSIEELLLLMDHLVYLYASMDNYRMQKKDFLTYEEIIDSIEMQRYSQRTPSFSL